MASALIPKDNQELAGFIRKFADALLENAGDDRILADAGRMLLEKLERFIRLDEQADAIAAEKKMINKQKYDLKDDIRVDAVNCRFYLKYKLAKTPEEMERFNVGGVPGDNHKFMGYIRMLGDSLVENAGGDQVLTDTGNSLLEKLEQYIGLDEHSLSLAADKKLINEEKHAVRAELRDDATQFINYLRYKLGKSSLELDKFLG